MRRARGLRRHRPPVRRRLHDAGRVTRGARCSWSGGWCRHRGDTHAAGDGRMADQRAPAGGSGPPPHRLTPHGRSDDATRPRPRGGPRRGPRTSTTCRQDTGGTHQEFRHRPGHQRRPLVRVGDRLPATRRSARRRNPRRRADLAARNQWGSLDHRPDRRHHELRLRPRRLFHLHRGRGRRRARRRRHRRPGPRPRVRRRKGRRLHLQR